MLKRMHRYFCNMVFLLRAATRSCGARMRLRNTRMCLAQVITICKVCAPVYSLGSTLLLVGQVIFECELSQTPTNPSTNYRSWNKKSRCFWCAYLVQTLKLTPVQAENINLGPPLGSFNNVRFNIFFMRFNLLL